MVHTLRKEMPELEKLRPALAAQGVELIGLNVDADPAAPIHEFLRQTKVQYPLYLGGAGAIEKLFAGDELSVPLSIVVDEKGIVLDLIPGWSGETKARFLKLAGM
jgi:hypothetical protein